MSDIKIYKDYSFMNNNDYHYSLSVENDFTYIRYFKCNEQKQTLMLPSDFAYEIAKKIIEEYERRHSNEMA